MNKANRRSALTLALGLATTALIASPAAHAAGDDLNSPVFVAPPPSQAQPNAAQPDNVWPAPPAAAPIQPGNAGGASGDNAAPQAPAPAASNEASPARSAPVMAASGEHSVWDETSLIGKIFIAFGALLTIASAARMFMA